MTDKPTERSFYHPILKLLEVRGFTGIQELSDSGAKNIVDILAEKKGEKYIFEIKKDSAQDSLVNGVLQAYRYAEKHQTKNMIVISFPNEPFQSITKLKDFEKKAISEKASILCLTEHWVIKQTASVNDFVKELNSKIENELKAAIDLDTVADALRELIHKTGKLSKKYFSDSRLENLIGDVDVFFSLLNSSEDGSNDKAMRDYVKSELIPYFLINQILFYQVFAKSTGKVKPISKEFTFVSDIQAKFDELVENIDYEPIFVLRLLDRFPDDSEEVITVLKDIVGAVDILRPENLDHDLLGRLFHYLLQNNVRRTLAAFYTQVKPAELLAGLSISRWDETVWDPACGSGTLLVSAYKRKFELYDGQKPETMSEEKRKDLHEEFLGKQITGSDIMAFATHLTAINLCSRHIDYTTNELRVAWRDSLEYSKLIHDEKFRETPSIDKIEKEMAGLSRKQRTITDFDEARHEKRKPQKRANGDPFPIRKADVVLMNPPFTDRHRFSEKRRIKIDSFTSLSDKVGSEVNLWGTFLALGDEILEDGGTLGAIIPTNVSRGKNTQKLRDWLLANYHFKYMVKPTRDNAFSEGSKYRDLMVVLEKNRRLDDKTGIVMIKVPLSELNEYDIHYIRDTILTTPQGKNVEDRRFDMYWVTKKEMLANRDSFSSLLAHTSIKEKKDVGQLLETILQNPKMFNLEHAKLFEGIKSKKGAGKYFYLTRESDRSRTARANLTFKHETSTEVFILTDKGPKGFPRKHLLPLIRTNVGLGVIDLKGNVDYVVSDPKAMEEFLGGVVDKDVKTYLLQRLKGDAKTHIALPDKINLKSENTRIIAAYSNDPVNISNALFGLRIYNQEYTKILALSLNSSLTLIQILIHQSDSLGGFDLSRLSAKDWTQIKLLDPDKLERSDKESLLTFFDEINSKKEFPSIQSQLERRESQRWELDCKILSILGYSDDDAEKLLRQMYEIILEKIRA